VSAIHELKCSPRHWPDYKSGLKNNSIRLNDRHYAVGDIVLLRLWADVNGGDGHFVLNEMVVRKITHILHDYDFAKMPNGWVILSLKEV
jgi:hypothetical protein